MLKSFFKDGALYFPAIVLARAIDILLIPVFSRFLSRAEFGILDLLIVPADMVGMAITLNLSEAVGRYFQQSRDPTERRSYASTGLWAELATLALFVPIGWCLAPHLARPILGDRALTPLLRLAVFVIVVRYFSLILLRQLRWELRPLPHSILLIVSGVVSNAVALVLIARCGLGVEAVLWGQLAAGIIVAGTALASLRRTFRLTFDPAKAWGLLAFGVPLIPGHVARFAVTYVDRLILRGAHGLAMVGIYGMATRLAYTIDIFLTAVGFTLTPLVFANFHRQDAPASLGRIFRYVAGVSLLAYVGYALFAPEVLRVFTVPAFYPAAEAVVWLVPARTLLGLAIFAPGFLVRNRTHLATAIHIAGFAVTLALNLVLAGPFAQVGTAAAGLIAAIATFTALMTFSHLLYPVPYPWRTLGKGLVVVLAAIWIGQFAPFALWPGLAVKCLLFTATAIALVACGLVEPAELRLAWATLKRQVGMPTPAPPGPRR